MPARFACLVAGLALTAPSIAQCDRIQLFGNAVAANAKFGHSVEIDGDLVAVGKTSISGPVRLFDAETGMQRGQLLVPPGIGVGKFGASIDIDGPHAVVGATGHAGALHIFSLPDAHHRRKITVPELEKGDLFGSNAAISGTRVLAGAPHRHKAVGFLAGTAYLFDATGVRPTIELIPSKPRGSDRFGFAVAIDSDFAIVSAPGSSPTQSGAVYVFDAVTGVELHRLTPSIPDMTLFGYSLGVDGGRLLVGSGWSPFAFLYDLRTGSELGVFQTPSGTDSVALNGNRAVLGNGYSMLWVFNTATNAIVGQIKSDLEIGSAFGRSLAVDGGRLVVGAPLWKNDTEGGAAFRIDLCDIDAVTYCSPAVPNSAGVPARLRPYGSSRRASNDFHLAAHDLPPGRPGFFLASKKRGFVPGAWGSDGNLCLGGHIFWAVGGVQRSSMSGTFETTVDFAELPVWAGQMWCFQAWFRDGPALDSLTTSNFTDATSVLFH